jgi:NH3-dependent NAD+ synthetase
MRHRSGISGGRRATAVGLIKARAFENNPGGEENSMDMARTIGASGQRRVSNMLQDLETMTTRFT